MDISGFADVCTHIVDRFSWWITPPRELRDFLVKMQNCGADTGP